jgi:hypothetical protein
VYKVYYWLTLLLFIAMFVLAAWFVCLVAINTTGELQTVPRMPFHGSQVMRCEAHHACLGLLSRLAHGKPAADVPC